MLVNIQDDMIELSERGLLKKLLVDKTTKGRILWGTDAYCERGEGYGKGREMEIPLFLYENLGIIKARARKALEQQSSRTKQHGEVFTPRWVCDKMIDAIDCDFFGFEMLPEDAWHHVDVLFSRTKKSWKKYVDNKRLEITCGEAPYLAERYDASTGEMIPAGERTGILDRKLHVVSAFTENEEDWTRWALRAFEATYGYEYQGDSLLIARVNLLKSFAEHYEARWGKAPSTKTLGKLANKVVWNLWQMDGLTARLPYCVEDVEGATLFAYAEMDIGAILSENQPDSHIYFWRSKKRIPFGQMKERDCKMKFDYIIGNPPYQDETIGDNKGFAPPIYNKFMDEAYKVSSKVELIHPARFLFNAGSTPKQWNEKMLKDKHFKVLHYEPNGSKIFPGTDIKGGIAITFHNLKKDYGAIETFTAFDELNTILRKVKPTITEPLSTIVSGRGVYKLSDEALEEKPEIEDLQSKGHKKDVGSGAFKVLKDVVFFAEKPADEEEYVEFLGLLNNKRVYYWGVKRYQDTPKSFYHYKVFIPKANGSGALGEVLSTPLIGEPLIGATESFLSIGSFETKQEAESCLKYIKGKFARAMLGVLKITQDNTSAKWKYVPLQDFTNKSDIDWSQSIQDIDRQLYKKYGLTQEEVDFIEKNVKEMK